MEGELWPVVYRLLGEEAKRRPRPKGVWYSDGRILEVYLWAVVHDRPTRWACQRRNWPPPQRHRPLPSQGRMSERLRTLSVRLLLAAVLDRLRELNDTPLARALDSKPLAVGGRSKDRDARWGYAGGTKARGYKLFAAWGAGPVPDAWTLGPMNRADAEAGAELVPQLAGAAYVLGDATHETNPLHAACGRCGMQLLAPRRLAGRGLGHGRHEPRRLRGIELMEWPVLLGTAPSPFGKALYALRGDVERRFGNLTGFGGGLQPLPSWVRTPHRVALWVAAKLVLNGVRYCLRKGLAA